MSKKKTFQETITHLALQNNFFRKILERTPAFNQFQGKTGGDVDAFIGTQEGRIVADSIGYPIINKRAIWVPRQLIEDHYLEIRLDLTRSRETLRAEFEAILDTADGNHLKGKEIIYDCGPRFPKVQRKPIPPRGVAIPDYQDDRIFRAFDMVEGYLAQGENLQTSVMKATNDLYRKARAIRFPSNPAEDKRYQQVSRWHQKVKEIIGNL